MSSRAATSATARPISKSLREYARGLAGGLMFSLPLLCTMEVWWTGFTSQPGRLLVYMAATFALLLAYNRYAGLRHDASWLEVAIDSVEEMGLGLLTAGLMLFLFGQLTGEMAANEMVGKIVVEAMTVAIGVSVGTAQLHGDKEDKGAAGSSVREEHHFGGQVAIALCGAVLFAANIAPTDEIVLIAHALSSAQLIALACLSMTLGPVILFQSEFRGAKRLVVRENAFQIVRITLITYAIALVAAAMILWFFARFDGQPAASCIAQVIVLAVAGALGASAGRLLLQ